MRFFKIDIGEVERLINIDYVVSVDFNGTYYGTNGPEEREVRFIFTNGEEATYIIPIADCEALQSLCVNNAGGTL